MNKGANGKLDLAPAATAGAVPLLDPARAPAISALEGLSDEQLIEGIHRQPAEASYLVAFYCRYQKLVGELLQNESNPAALAQRCWFAAFDVLIRQKRSERLPAAAWLGRLIAQTIIHRGSDSDLTGSCLPAPLAWYVMQSLDAMIPMARIALVLLEAESYSEEQLTRFYYERGLDLSAEAIRELCRDAQKQLITGIPATALVLFFGSAEEAAAPLAALPQLGLSRIQETRRFERWQTLQTAYRQELAETKPAVLPEEQLYKSPVAPEAAPVPRQRLQPLLGLVLVALGFAGLGALLYQVWWQATNHPQSPPVETSVASEPMLETDPVLAPAAPIPPKTAPAESTISQGSAAPVAQGRSSTSLPFVAGDRPNPYSHYIYVVVADPGRQNLAKLQRLQRDAFYRVIAGENYVQFGAYGTIQQAQYALSQLKNAGFNGELARS
ncbi:hypothetical protein [Gloeobacter kilaueensis]|uniref:Uncharacterized protein n=1 Tax=Gloeobacter kilaueensis (strain ATCC BAA-2537 / CCAP 1431/1 / ULC 316 / JS1) TaxID=1183438 RepID=U5QLQ2_GLOK1|nr:hypothetical protein [Gloeobacter kilaueensis]AGY59831.1 hypothetical protein GKIL_3585 [Gloeobacter kilaueensis JS1]